MKKKLLTILFIAVFLIASISFISAADSLPVKVVWDDANQANERPNEITVNLLCDGKVVDTVKLSASNSWKTTFKNLDETGSYKIQVASNPTDYSIQTTGNAESGFVITAKLTAPLESSNDTPKEVNETPIENESEQTNDANITDDNTTDDEVISNSTDDANITDDNTTDDEVISNSTDDANATEDNSTDENNTSKDNKTPTNPKKTPVKQNNVVNQTKKSHMQKTGIPLAGLVLITFVAAFVPFSRKK